MTSTYFVGFDTGSILSVRATVLVVARPRRTVRVLEAEPYALPVRVGTSKTVLDTSWTRRPSISPLTWSDALPGALLEVATS